jgi:hypothetical protein
MKTISFEDKTLEELLGELSNPNLREICIKIDPFGRITESEIDLNKPYGEYLKTLKKHKLIDEVIDKKYYIDSEDEIRALVEEYF